MRGAESFPLYLISVRVPLVPLRQAELLSSLASIVQCDDEGDALQWVHLLTYLAAEPSSGRAAEVFF